MLVEIRFRPSYRGFLARSPSEPVRDKVRWFKAQKEVRTLLQKYRAWEQMQVQTPSSRPSLGRVTMLRGDQVIRVRGFESHRSPPPHWDICTAPLFFLIL